eukprot:TRINITY_DN4605_c0_g1_i1.p1 TRINITY_DN4605_c0_g1~~TRINITY_DN4605_c0_g1_i1.p1  ORF type:complete len:445 (+),score=159.52 TRINITY_DN4605_c0_g1_i1:178-1512(+)
MSMNIPQITRNLGNIRLNPSIISKPYSAATQQHVYGSSFVPQHFYQNQVQGIQYYNQYQPQQVVLVPYGTPFMYSNMPYYQPVTYPQFQVPQQQFNQNYIPVAPRRRQQNPAAPQQKDQKLRNSTIVDPNVTEVPQFSYAPGMAEIIEFGSDPLAERGSLTIHMEVPELYENMKACLEVNQNCRVSWLNRMLSKCNTTEEFEQALEIFKLYQEKSIETTPETATLLIKAACRAEIPETALNLLQNADEISVSPTLGGIHYLMINFSLKKDTKAVMDTYALTRSRNLKPTTRTFHILIRECVDNDLIEEAMSFAQESKKLNIIPNRVTYNILMNGLRKFNKGEEILELRQQMNDHKIEINDTTVKFTVLAHLMKKNTDDAVQEFMSYEGLNGDLEGFSLKFFEVTEESVDQKQHVVDLFKVLKDKIELPESVQAKLASLTEIIKN